MKEWSRGHGVAPGNGRGARVSWSEAPLEPSLSLRERLAMSERENIERLINKYALCQIFLLYMFFSLNYFLFINCRFYLQFSQLLKSPNM